ncbi:MAG TPA: diphosphomevalonate decarboxylase [Sorangium sp.]|nr:diphosphomevalonate decarboxylase [Sorangium sp.]
MSESKQHLNIKSCLALAHPNIALAKYWGKCNHGHNLPAVPSLSITLAGMHTRTAVSASECGADSFILDGEVTVGRPLRRVSQLLDLLWRRAGRTAPRPHLAVRSENDFPTAAGLASSASAFAALATAGNHALSCGLSLAALSCLARQVSASAGRSLFGGFVQLRAGQPGDTTLAAEQVAPADHWNIALVVAVTARGKKEVGSTEGMIHTAATSPLYNSWISAAPGIFARVKQALLARDMVALGTAVEHSALSMHATALAADPGLLYWNGGSMNVMRAVRGLRRDGVQAYFTIDAGPHVKVLCAQADATAVAQHLNDVAGVQRTIMARPGAGASVVEA